MTVYRNFPGRRRRGATLVEATVAVAVTFAVVSLVAKLAVVTTRAREAASQRAVATQEAANVMERLMAQSWDALDEQAANDAQLSQLAMKSLVDAELTAKVDELDDGQLKLKRIHVQVRWRSAAGQRTAPVTLAAWKTQVEEQ